LAVVAAGALLLLAVVLLAKRRERGPRLTVAHARPKEGDVLAYTATYLLPFLSLDLTKRERRLSSPGSSWSSGSSASTRT
jgi:hypothetical protein